MVLESSEKYFKILICRNITTSRAGSSFFLDKDKHQCYRCRYDEGKEHPVDTGSMTLKTRRNVLQNTAEDEHNTVEECA